MTDTPMNTALLSTSWTQPLHERVGLELVAERHRQIVALGRGPVHDDEYVNSELARAAAALATKAAALQLDDRTVLARHMNTQAALINPFVGSNLVRKQTDARRALIEAGALIIAAVEQIDRAEARAKAKAHG